MLINLRNSRLRFTSLISVTWAVILGRQVLEWQPGDNRSLSVPDGAAVEVFDSWDGALSPAALHRVVPPKARLSPLENRAR